MKVNIKDFGNKRPKLEQEHLEDDVAILTITEAEVLTVDAGGDEERQSIVLAFKETGDYVLWPNATEIRTLIEKLGDDTDEWTGQRVPVEKVTRSYRGKKFDKVGVVDAAEWDQYLGKKKVSAVKGKKR